MDIASLAISIILSLFFIIPVSLLIYSVKQKERKLKNAFLSAINENNLIIAKHESWKNKIIGIDNTNDKLLFIHLAADQIKEDLVDLNQISYCTIRHSGIKNYKEGSHSNTSDKLELSLISKDKKVEDINIPFFDLNSNNPFELKSMQDKAGEWQKLIEKKLK
ncbi:MAG: hypothetical protein Q8862_13100 [Bacteroidota bacterium]|nr:hypothetical protein [Bacteroidota bacterium]